jgi:RNA polymerase sigma factor (sigma-70 family)
MTIDNIAAIREYRHALDVAEGVRLARGLYEVVTGSGTELAPGLVCSLMNELSAIVALGEGLSDAALERKATRMRDALVKTNMPLVFRVARRLLGARKSNPDNLTEAVQEGSIGLMRAIHEFDPARGSFATCAVMWIRHHVQTCMHAQTDFAKQRSACMPPGVVQQTIKFRTLNGREAHFSDLTHKGAPVTQEMWERWTDGATVKSVDDMQDARDGGAAFEIADPTQAPDSTLITCALQERFDKEIAALSPRNQDIARALLVDGKSLSEVAEDFKVVPSRIHKVKHQIEQRFRKVLDAS